MLYYNLRSLRVWWRRYLSAVLVLGLATTIFLVLEAALYSFSGLLATSVESDNVVILHRGEFQERWPELNRIAPSLIPAIQSVTGIAKNNHGELLVSPEYLYT